MPLPTYNQAGLKKEQSNIMALRTALTHEGTTVEMCVACLFEHARELVWTLPPEWAGPLFGRHPWRVMAETKDFPSVSYLDLPETDCKRVLATFSDRNQPLQLDNRLYAAMGVYDGLKAMAEKDHGGKIEFQPARIKNSGNPEGDIEHVMLTLNYRLGRKRLLAQIENWLDTNASSLFEKYSRTHQGLGLSLFTDRLSDLIKTRAARLLGRKEAKRFLGALGPLSDFDEAAERMKKFIGFLKLCSFDSLPVLLDSWSRYEFPSQEEYELQRREKESLALMRKIKKANPPPAV